MTSDQDLIKRIRKRDTRAFETLFDRYQAPVHRHLVRITHDEAAAQDLAQEVFLRVWTRAEQWHKEGSFKAWLYRIATNNALQYHRRKKLLSFIPFTSKERDLSATSNKADCPGEAPAVHEALLRVPKEQRTCLVLHFVEGFKYREIAETLGCSEDAVRKRVARGKKLFIDLYNQEGGGV